MAHSMTAFSRQQIDSEWGALTWELRSVNHRYLEPSIRLPENFRSLETPIRKQLRDKLNRGKIECQLRFKAVEPSKINWQLDTDMITRLSRANSEINRLTGGDRSLKNIDILKWPGVISDESLDEEIFNNEVLELFDRALDDLIMARKREGESLKNMLLKRIESIQSITDAIRVKMPNIIAKQKENLFLRLEELKAEFEPTRLEQELSLIHI